MYYKIYFIIGSSACTESGETDSDNQQIAVKSHLRTDNRHLKKNKRSLPSVLKEVCVIQTYNDLIMANEPESVLSFKTLLETVKLINYCTYIEYFSVLGMCK